jgi:hypothetical protein
MANRWTDEQQKFLKQNFSIRGRMLFPNLLKARAKEAGKRETFDGQFAWNPQENAAVTQQLFQYIQQAVAMFHTGLNPAALVSPIKDFNTYQRQDAKANPEYLRGMLWVNASTGKEFPPQVVKNSPMGLVKLSEADEAEVYSGRNVIFNISFYPMIPQPGSANQKRGFSCNINAVMLCDGGDVIGGSSSVDVNQVFGGMMQDMGAQFNPGGFANNNQFQQPPVVNNQPQYNAPAVNNQFQQAPQVPNVPAFPGQAPVNNAPMPNVPQWNQTPPQVNNQAPAQPNWNSPGQPNVPNFNPNFNPNTGR